MNNTLDIKRLGKYFLYDLRRAKNNYGLSLLLMGLTPVIFFLLYIFYCFLWSLEVGQMPQTMKFVSLFVALTVVIFGAGAKLYGFVTEKRSGSDFLMLPVSGVEKWISIVLMVCVALPLVLFSLLVASDALMSVLLPTHYGSRLFSSISSLFHRFFTAEPDISVNLPAILCCNWCENLLIFTLGAVCFKKSKVAKTFLCTLAVGMAASSVSALFFGTPSSVDWLRENFTDPVSAATALNWFLSVVFSLVVGGLLAALYYRIRTLQH